MRPEENNCVDLPDSPASLSGVSGPTGEEERCKTVPPETLTSPSEMGRTLSPPHISPSPHSSLVSSLEYLWAVVECRRQLIVWWTGPVLCSQSTQHLPLLTKLQLCFSHGSDYQLRDQTVCIALEGSGRSGGGEG